MNKDILIHRVDKWKIYLTPNAVGNFTVMIESPKGVTDTAVYYAFNDTVGWGFPESLPKRVMRKAENILRNMRKASK
jgi:hypothetical protein